MVQLETSLLVKVPLDTTKARNKIGLNFQPRPFSFGKNATRNVHLTRKDQTHPFTIIRRNWLQMEHKHFDFDYAKLLGKAPSWKMHSL